MFRTFLYRLRGLLEAPRRIAHAPTHVRRLERADDRLSGELTLIERLSDGDCILCVAGDVVPCRGMVVNGFASVRHAASAPAPNDRGDVVLRRGSLALPGMTVVANFLVVRVEESTAELTTRTLSRGPRRSTEQSESV